MPMQSKAQARWMFANHPAMAREFAVKTKSMKSLPDHVKKARVTVGKKSYDHETIRQAIMKVEGRA